MSELIDRQALLDECLNHYEVDNIEQNCTMDWICKTVRNFPTASPWHRVAEELPKEEGRYFIAVFYKGKWLYNVAWFVKDIGDILGVPGSDGNGGFVSNSAEVYPDCWMMPIEPPKEETK